MIRYATPLAALIAATLLWSGPLAPAGMAQDQKLEPGQQTTQTLKKMLDDMGFDYKEQTGTDSRGPWTRYLVTVASGGRDWKILTEISSNQENLWLTAELAKAPDVKTVPREILDRMLKLNEATGPCYFALDEKTGIFMMFQPLTNRGITPKLLRQRLESIADNVNKYEKVWNPQFWSNPTTPPAPEVLSLIQNLASKDEMVRLKAAKDLAKLGPTASAALPALRNLLQDPDEDVRRVAANAIDRIEGVTTPTPGPKTVEPKKTPTPGPEPKKNGFPTVADTTWEGTESLSGFGKLTFRFTTGFHAVMTDAVSTTNGIWSQNNNDVTVSFQNCVYTGKINGNVFAGTAKFTVGEPREWTFSLTRVVAAPMSVVSNASQADGGRRRNGESVPLPGSKPVGTLSARGRSSAAAPVAVQADQKDVMVYQQFKVRDSLAKLDALSLLVPRGWKTSGGMSYSWNKATLVDLEMRVYDPNSPRQVEFLPRISCYWTPGLPVPRGTILTGLEVQPPVTDPRQFVQQYIIPRHRPHVGAVVEGVTLMPEVAHAAATAVDPTGNLKVIAARVRLTYNLKSQPVEEDVYLFLYTAQSLGTPIVLSGADRVFAIRSAKGKLDADSMALLTIVDSVRYDLQWYASYQRALEIWYQTQQYASDQAMIRSKIIAAGNAQVTAIIRSKYEAQQAAMDRINQQWSNYIRGVDQYNSPYATNPVSLPSGYNQVWGNALGEYVLSNDLSFNPNQSLSGDWQLLQPAAR